MFKKQLKSLGELSGQTKIATFVFFFGDFLWVKKRIFLGTLYHENWKHLYNLPGLTDPKFLLVGCELPLHENNHDLTVCEKTAGFFLDTWKNFGSSQILFLIWKFGILIWPNWNNSSPTYIYRSIFLKIAGDFPCQKATFWGLRSCFRSRANLSWFYPTKSTKPSFYSMSIVGGWTNPFEKYARQNGNLPQFSGWKQKIFELPPPRCVTIPTLPEAAPISPWKWHPPQSLTGKIPENGGSSRLPVMWTREPQGVDGWQMKFSVWWKTGSAHFQHWISILLET